MEFVRLKVKYEVTFVVKILFQIIMLEQEYWQYIPLFQSDMAKELVPFIVTMKFTYGPNIHPLTQSLYSYLLDN